MLDMIYKMEHNLINMPLDHYVQHNSIDPYVSLHDSQFLEIDTLQTYLETASSQPQLKNRIICPQTLSQVNH